MLFYDPLFLTLFPILYVLYLAVRDGLAKKWILLVASLFFYAWGEPLFVPVLMVSTWIDYLLARHLQPHADDDVNAMQRRRLLLTIGVLLNIALLFFYKYTDFLIGNVNAVLAPFGAAQIPLLKIALPIGVSFVVFEKITYLVDTYRGISRPARGFSDYCLFVLLFPKLLAGPILKYHELDRQIATPPPFAWDDFWSGFTRFARGVFKKLLIADPVGACADQIFGADPWGIGIGYAWLGVVCSTIQIYFDFSGYSDMAIGLARMFGFRLRENFNMPYTARSLTEFWQRWHISLTTWIRDYLYYPLGGSRGAVWRTYANLWICFLLSGLWHGASTTFIAWGAYNGLFLVMDKLCWLRVVDRVPRPFTVAINLLLVMIGWNLFRSADFSQAVGMFSAMACPGRTGEFVWVQNHQWAAIAIGMAGALIASTALFQRLLANAETSSAGRILGALGLAALGSLAVLKAVTVTFNPFLYFRF